MSIEILIEGSMEFNDVLRNDRKEQLSLFSTLWCTQTEDISLLAASV